jgi:phage shock protein PspC (stress-responsive transcriptional regulator)
MNKTLTINLGGYVFHIDEIAFETLSNYIIAIKGHFANPETRNEIMSDVEARLADLFKIELAKGREVISEDDVAKVISVMGNPEDFGDDSENKGEKPFSNPSAFDFGIPNRRRIFRDPDERVLGGICSGIANYFGFDPVWLRLIWALSFFIFGFGLLLYIILWIILPSAKTTAEKLEMRGEPVNLQNIEKQVKEEMKDLENRVKTFGKGAKKWSQIGGQSRLTDFITDLFRLLGQIILGILKFVGGFVGLTLLIIACVFGVIFLSSVFGTMDIVNVNLNGQSFGLDIPEILNRIFVSESDKNITSIALILFALVPIFLLFYLGIRLLFKIQHNVFISWIIAALIISGITLLILPLKNLRKETKALYVTREKVAINSNLDTLFLESDPKTHSLLIPDFNDSQDGDINIKGNWNILLENETPVLVGLTHLNVVQSQSDSTWFEVIRSAKGPTKESAETRAKKIDYGISQREGKLVVNGFFTLAENEKLRNQKLTVLLHLAKGKTVFLSPNIGPIIYDLKNLSNTYDNTMLGHYWTMTMNGLACKDFQNSKSENAEEEEEEDWDGKGEITETEEIDLGNGKKEIRVKVTERNGRVTETTEIDLGGGKKEVQVKVIDKNGTLETENISAPKPPASPKIKYKKEIRIEKRNEKQESLNKFEHPKNLFERLLNNLEGLV